MKLLLLAAVVSLTASDPAVVPQQFTWHPNGIYYQAPQQQQQLQQHFQQLQPVSPNWPFVAQPYAQVILIYAFRFYLKMHPKNGVSCRTMLSTKPGVSNSGYPEG
jgi:hypothetical protein